MKHAWTVAGVLLVAGCVSTGPQPSDSPGPSSPLQESTTSPSPSAGTPWGPDHFGDCTGSGPVTFTVAPMRATDYRMIIPYGALAGAHVTPIDHMYFAPEDQGGPRDQYEVRAIADGVVYNLQPRDVDVDTGQPRSPDWRMDIAHTCTFTSYFDLLNSLEPGLWAEYNETLEHGGAIHLHAGQVVGRIGGQTLDFGVYDANVTLPGFVVPEHYDREGWKVHTVDPFPYFDEAVRGELLAKLLRQVEPRAGKIDHDIDGRLVGNWFRVGTNGYAGTDPARYWAGHLAVVFDHLDPSQLRFSTGDWNGEARSFGVEPGWLDPREVSPETGPVQWELSHFYTYYARNDPGREGLGPDGVRPGDDVAAKNVGPVEGTVRLELTGARTLKVETFPGQAAVEIDGFTAAAREFER